MSCTTDPELHTTNDIQVLFATKLESPSLTVQISPADNDLVTPPPFLADDLVTPPPILADNEGLSTDNPNLIGRQRVIGR